MGRPLFREEALRHHSRSRDLGGVVRRPPRWTGIAFPIVVAIAALGVAELVFGRAPQVARGPAVVRAERVGDEDRYTAQALLPASLRSELKAGSPLRLEIDDHPGAIVEASIARIDDRVLTPEEARRFLDTDPRLDVSGSVVVARADLPGTTFRAAGGSRPYSDGMTATAETPARSEPLIYALFPGLRAALSH